MQANDGHAAMTDFDELERSLKQLESPLMAAETHGLLTGLLVADLATPLETVFDEVLEERPDPNDVLMRERLRPLREVYEQTRAALMDPELGFAPLLPDEEEVAFARRLRALAHWVQGFVYGLGRGGVRVEALKGEPGELLRDLIEISKLDEESAEDDEAEADLFELTEFVRMGALLLAEELQPFKAPPVVQ
ncbi:MAG: YecA family protein [Gammaproteobacteria bacterium]|nr:MAG: YecA family protein [Gammaproteobacteria bacterium]